jgi:hypothetical protein
LAFDKLFIEEYRASRTRNSMTIRFVLVPSDLGRAIDLWKIRVVTMSGEPKGIVQADPFGLASVRSKISHGLDIAVEGMILERLLERARARGHILPTIILTTAIPEWSRMSVEGDLLWELRRVAAG